MFLLATTTVVLLADATGINKSVLPVRRQSSKEVLRHHVVEHVDAAVRREAVQHVNSQHGHREEHRSAIGTAIGKVKEQFVHIVAGNESQLAANSGTNVANRSNRGEVPPGWARSLTRKSRPFSASHEVAVQAPSTTADAAWAGFTTTASGPITTVIIVQQRDQSPVVVKEEGTTTEAPDEGTSLWVWFFLPLVASCFCAVAGLVVVRAWWDRQREAAGGGENSEEVTTPAPAKRPSLARSSTGPGRGSFIGRLSSMRQENILNQQSTSESTDWVARRASLGNKHRSDQSGGESCPEIVVGRAKFEEPSSSNAARPRLQPLMPRASTSTATAPPGGADNTPAQGPVRLRPLTPRRPSTSGASAKPDDAEIY